MKSHVRIDRRALVDTPHVGSGTRVWEFTHVLTGARIGRDCRICRAIIDVMSGVAVG